MLRRVAVYYAETAAGRSPVLPNKRFSGPVIANTESVQRVFHNNKSRRGRHFVVMVTRSSRRCQMGGSVQGHSGWLGARQLSQELRRQETNSRFDQKQRERVWRICRQTLVIA